MRVNVEDPKIYRGRNDGPMFWGTSRSILTGSYVIGSQAGVVHFLDPNGADRDVYLPEISVGGGQVYVVTNVGSANNIEVRDATGTLISTLTPQADFAIFISHGTTWVTGLLADASGASDYFPDYAVNAKDFGVLGNGFNDDTDGLQAAVDWAFTHGKSAVMVPDGFYCVTRKPIWIAPPGSYSSVDPQTGGTFDQFQFSMSFIGGQTLGNSLYLGVTIETYGETGGVIDFGVPYPDYPAVIVGPGQGMRVAGFNIRGNGGSLWPTTFNPASIGIAISGGPGGASRTMIERCWVQNMYTGFKVGWNEDSLGDSNTFFKCVTNSCYYGLDIFRTQNYINNVWDCNFQGVVMIRSIVGKTVNVWGGNYSYSGNVDQDFNISGTTTLTPGPAAAMQAFDTTLSFPGIGLGGGLDAFSENALTDGGQILYNCAAIETAHFGVIPLRPLSYNSTTNVMSLLIDENWILANFGISPDFSSTDLQAEIQAATLLMMGVRRTVFQGTGIHARGIHLESPSAVSCLIEQTSGFQGDKGSTVEDLYLNWDPPLDVNTSQRKLMSCWPWIDVNQASDVVIRGGLWASSQQLPFLFATSNGRQIYFENFELRRFNIRTSGNFFGNINAGGGDGLISPIRGFGVYPDHTPFVPKNSNGHGMLFLSGLGRHPHKGVVPQASPPLTQAYVDTFLSGSLPAKGDYPPLFGNVPYRIIKLGTTGAPSETGLVSNHDFYSYGQNFTVNWSYKGQSHHLYVDDIGWFFPGLKFGIDNGSGIQWYVVIGIYPDVTLNTSSGYLIVHAYDNGFSPSPLVGNKTTVFTGSTIYQEAYDFTRIGGTAEAAFEVLIVGDSGGVITTGIKVHALRVPFDCTLTGVSMFADQTGSVVVDIWKDTYANYPPDNADSITSATPPTISSGVKMTDTTLTGWTIDFVEGDILRINVDSVSNFTTLTIVLEVNKR